MDKKGYRHSLEYKQALANMLDQKWRLNNLYYIITDEGFKTRFEMNEAQEWLYDNRHFWNLILKSRQQGFTTFICMYMLDTCIFNSNTECAMIAHTLEDANKIFRRKIKFPYDNLPPALKDRVKLTKDSESGLIFKNGSAISTGVSARSGTYQVLHVSEFAKICAKAPEKAREIVTGSFETLAPGQELFVECTAEGREGYFFEYCKEARDRVKLSYPLNPQEFKFHFFPWYLKPTNRLEVREGDDIVFPTKLREYFNELENSLGIKLDIPQRYWYMNKLKTLGDDMKREHPSTPEEAFEQSIEGTYFAKEFLKIRDEQRICRVPYEPSFEVHTAWDLGVNDVSSIWFWQLIGKEVRIIDYYQNHGEGLGFYRDILDEKKYRYGKHLAPHDIAVRELGTGKTRLETAAGLGIHFEVVERVPKKNDAIQSARSLLTTCWFDAERCAEGIIHLETYRKEWDEKYGTWKNKPRHDESSNAADAFQTLSMGFDKVSRRRWVKPTKVEAKDRWRASLGF